MSYEKLGLKCGIEIHQQLEGKKLFCNCPTTMRDDQPHFTIKRKLRASAGESGEVDIAAQQEQVRDKTFIYEGYKDTTCLVETDSEPPHDINKETLHTVLQFCKITNADVSPVVQVMRKTVVDGSNTSGFQRTALIARNGSVETSEGIVRFQNISLEEDACKVISETNDEKTYRLDRLGIPLIEIGTRPDIKTPEQCQETAKKIGMILRSLPNIKRGIGTIRQDVNVSIKGGTRIEIKGAQDLRQLPLLVELEAKRQAELLKIKDELRHHRLNDFAIADLSVLLQSADSKIVQKTIENNGKILGIKLHGFAGLVGRELQPNYRVGSEFSGRAKIKAGVGGIFHSDELPNYGIQEKEIKLIRKKLSCTQQDAFILVADEEKKARIALEAVYDRAKELFQDVPKEVRKANANGTTSFLRPMPGAARMYPETDVPLIRPDVTNIELPELLDAKIARYQEEFEISMDLAQSIAKNNPVLFEELVVKYPTIKPAFIAATLTSTLIEIKRKYKLDSASLQDKNFKELFEYLAQEKIHKDIILDVLIDMIKGTFDITKYESVKTEEIHKVIKEIVEKNKDAPFGALMGMCMKRFAGKVSGKIISDELNKLVT
ncbi:Glu-tRNA(Gln) amidotransferase GatDE subunit E [Candidatus Woesearchaeota archaeon CG10_big_fil_rev_8_21_14_0_10_36_11]|nr:MAG: Glu-tRNA(Gln) amidotransferase GatDE subunit E [Candidatus Woesearchaeota archaeon CG10_big_fil_rev_8_21_14_0_10_36_11]